MKKFFRYRYDNETNYTAVIIIAVLLTIFWLILVISQYGYYMEKFSLKAWLAERVGMGIFSLIFCLIAVLCLSFDGDRKYRKEVMQNGKCYDGEIVGYVTKRNTYIHNGRESLVHPKTYILYIKCRGETIITSPLRGNPERVLKSNKCHVYYYRNQKYVTDFDERFFRIGKYISVPEVKTEFLGV